MVQDNSDGVGQQWWCWITVMVRDNSDGAGQQ